MWWITTGKKHDKQSLKIQWTIKQLSNKISPLYKVYQSLIVNESVIHVFESCHTSDRRFPNNHLFSIQSTWVHVELGFVKICNSVVIELAIYSRNGISVTQSWLTRVGNAYHSSTQMFGFQSSLYVCLSF